MSLAPERDVIWLPAGRLTGRQIIAVVASNHGLTVEDMKGPSRTKHISHVRQEAMWEIRQCTKLSLPQIARLLGRTDHTTAWHGVKAHAARLAERERAAA